MTTAEIFLPPGTNATGRRILMAIEGAAEHAGVRATCIEHYTGKSHWLVIWGVGAPGRSELRDRHVRIGGLVALWDIGFFKRAKLDGHCKVSINDDYATKWLDRTPPNPQRWESFGLALRDDYDPAGHIVLAGIGPKQHAYMAGKIDTWERDKWWELKRRFPGRRIVYRPKPGREYIALECETDGKSEIEDVLRGASLVVCMHSNVAIDAVLAGVPYESEDGVSTWLRDKPYTLKTRLDFVQRLSNWQWKQHEMIEAWQFLRSMTHNA